MNETQLYTVTEAAAYLKLSVPYFKAFVYGKKDKEGNILVEKQIEPDRRIGRSLVFYQSTLDKFKQRYDAQLRAEGLTLAEAAEYLGVEEHVLGYQMWGTGRLKADAKRGKFQVFSIARLEAIRPYLKVSTGETPKASAE